jgi:hypothetical protein
VARLGVRRSTGRLCGCSIAVSRGAAIQCRSRAKGVVGKETRRLARGARSAGKR